MEVCDIEKSNQHKINPTVTAQMTAYFFVTDDSCSRSFHRLCPSNVHYFKSFLSRFKRDKKN